MNISLIYVQVNISLTYVQVNISLTYVQVNISGMDGSLGRVKFTVLIKLREFLFPD